MPVTTRAKDGARLSQPAALTLALSRRERGLSLQTLSRRERGPKKSATISIAPGPLRRTIPRAAPPGGEAMAAMVSSRGNIRNC